MEKREWKIYKRENKINGKIYIGQTMQYNWKTRLKQENGAVKYFDKPQAISVAIAKYGVENFEDKIIDYAYSQEEADEKEIYWISFYNSFEKGYNRTLGGQGIGSDCGASVACWNLSTRVKYDSIASLARSTDSTNNHVWQVLNRTMPSDGNSCLTQLKGAYIMKDSELQESFDNDIDKAIEFIEGIREENRKARCKNAKLRGDLQTIEKFLPTIPQDKELSDLDYCQFLIKNIIHIKHYAYCNDEVATLLLDWEEYLDILKYLISRDTRYMQVYEGKLSSEDFNVILEGMETSFSPEYCSNLWNSRFPLKVVNYLTIKKELELHIEKNLPWRVCNRCGNAYPLSVVFFSINKNTWCGLYSLDRGCRTTKEDTEWHEIYMDLIDEMEVDLTQVPLVKNGKQYKKYMEELENGK